MVSWPPQQCLVPSVLRHGEHSPGRLCLWPSAPKEDAMDQHGMSICPNLEPLSCPINAKSLLQLHLPPRQVSSKPSHLGWESYLATKRGSRSCNACDLLWHAVHRMTLTYLPSKQWWIMPWDGYTQTCAFPENHLWNGVHVSLKRGHHPKKMSRFPLVLGHVTELLHLREVEQGAQAMKMAQEILPGRTGVGEVRISYSYLPPYHIVLGWSWLYHIPIFADEAEPQIPLWSH